MKCRAVEVLQDERTEQVTKMYGTKALEAMQGIDGVCTDEEIAFLGLHRRVYGSVYHAALTCGRINDLLDSTRREVQKSFPRIKGDGLERIQKRYQLYVKN